MLTFHFGSTEAFVAFLDDEPTDHTVEFGPNNGHIGDGSVGDPHFGTVQEIVVALVFCFGDHVAGVGAVVGLGKAETADPFA